MGLTCLEQTSSTIHCRGTGLLFETTIFFKEFYKGIFYFNFEENRSKIVCTVYNYYSLSKTIQYVFWEQGSVLLTILWKFAINKLELNIEII